MADAKPKFDPSQPYDPAPPKPAFDPKQPFSAQDPEEPGVFKKAVFSVLGGLEYLTEKEQEYLGASSIRKGISEFGKTGSFGSALTAASKQYGEPGAPSGREAVVDAGLSQKPSPQWQPKDLFSKEEQAALLKKGTPYNASRGEFLINSGPSPADLGGIALDFVDPGIALTGGALKYGGAAAKDAVGLTAEGLGKVLPKLKPNAAEIEAATKAIGGKATPGQLFDSKLVQNLENLQQESPGQLGGIFTRNQIKANQDAASKAAEELLVDRARKEGVDIGSDFEKVYKEELSKKLEPAEQIYGAWEDALKETNIPISTNSLKQSLSKISEEVKFSPEATAKAESLSQALDSVKSIDDLKQLRSVVGNDLKAERNGNLRYVLSDFYKNLSLARSDSLKELAKSSQTQDFAEKALKQLSEADQIYKNTANEVSESLLNRGKKSSFGPKRTAEDFFDKSTEIDRLNKVLKTNDPKRIAAIKESFPEAFDILRQGKIEEFARAAEKDGKINYGTLSRNLSKIPVESQNLIFGEGASEKIKALKAFVESAPAPVNPSRTALTQVLLNMANPYTQATGLARSAIYNGLSAGKKVEGALRRFSESGGLALPKEPGLFIPKQNPLKKN